MNIKKILKNIFTGLKEYLDEIAYERVESELREKELIFTILVLGPLIGLPIPLPITLSLKLLPYMLQEVQHAQRKSMLLDDPTSLIGALLDIV